MEPDRTRVDPFIVPMGCTESEDCPTESHHHAVTCPCHPLSVMMKQAGRYEDRRVGPSWLWWFKLIGWSVVTALCIFILVWAVAH